MKTILLTGATGMVGGEALKACLASEEVESVISLVRRPTGLSHEKLIELIRENFGDFSGMEKYFKGVDLALYCLAVNQGKVNKEQYRTLTVDYTEAFAKTLKENSPEATFCLFSAAGALSSEKSRMQFARDKGAAENRVFAQGFDRAYAFRPGYIYPVQKRKEPSNMYRLFRRIYPLLKAIGPGSVIPSEQLGRAMLTIGLKGGKKSIYENKDIQGVQT